MPTFILRDGKSIPADEVFLAWTSADLGRMLAARSASTHPVDRHFLLMGIVGQTYARREDPKMRELCLEVGRQHVREFASIASALAADMGGWLPRVSTFAYLAAVLVEGSQFEEAIGICRQAIEFGLNDGTKGDYSGRIARIEKAAAKARRGAS